MRSIPAGLTHAGFQRSVLANSTAIAVTSTVRALNPRMLMISAETNNVRMRLDAVPTKATGVLIVAGQQPVAINYNGTSALRFQRSTGTAIVQIVGWKYLKG